MAKLPYDTNELLKRGQAMLDQTKAQGTAAFTGSSFDTPQAQQLQKTDPVSLQNFQKANPGLSFGQQDMNAYNAAGGTQITPATNVSVTPPKAVSPDSVGTNTNVSALQKALDNNQAMMSKYDEQVKAYQDALNAPDEGISTLNDQVSAIRKKADALTASKQTGLDYTEYQTIPMEFITGQQASIEKRANTQMQTLAAQEKSLLADLGIKQEARKTKLDGLKEIIGFGKDKIGFGQSEVENALKIQEALQKEQDTILEAMKNKSTEAKETLATILTQWDGVSWDELDEETQSEIANLGYTRNLPIGMIIAGMNNTAKSKKAKELQDAQAATLDASYKKSQIAKNNADIAGGGEANKVLSVADAIALGVPYGTRQSQATGLVPQKPLTDAQNVTSLYADRLENSGRIVDSRVEDAKKMGPAQFFAAQQAEKIGGLANLFISNNIQSLFQAQRDFINATLRRESGAVIAETEFENARRQYFPQPGDTADTLAQKKANRDIVIAGFRKGSGGNQQNSQAPAGRTGGADISDLNFKF